MLRYWFRTVNFQCRHKASTLLATPSGRRPLVQLSSTAPFRFAELGRSEGPDYSGLATLPHPPFPPLSPPFPNPHPSFH